MNTNEPITLKSVSNIMIGGAVLALALVGAVWGVLGIFVL